MLTKWKQARTSFEHSHSTSNATKKKRPQDARTSSSEDIAISFVKPLARQNPFYQQRIKSSKNTGKKRRKSNHGRADTSETLEDMEPILCITSSHRVALFGRSSAASGATLSESKMRNYVSRPGTGTSFDVSSNSNSLKGDISCGAQYDPASNLLYAIRNGSEIAIWTAASSSVIQGPDQSVDGLTEVANQHTKKRKECDSYASFDEVISERLRFPEGKIAATLNTFYIPSSAGESQKLLAVGASGCCEDGSIWIAICRDGNSSFELFIVDGSSMTDNEVKRKTTKRKATPAKSKKQGRGAVRNWKLLDSRITDPIQSGSGDALGSFVINVRSVLLSEGDGSVILRQHQVKVHVEGGKESSCVEKSWRQSIIEVSNKDDIVARLDNSGDSLCAIHKNDSGGWVLSSIEICLQDDGLVTSVSSITLTQEAKQNAALFSFGSLGQNVYAILSKKSCPASDLSFSKLRIVDVRRKVELLVHSWKEGGDQEEEISSSDNVLTKMLYGKHCRAMLTNELDGSLVLVTYSSSGAIGFISSTISAADASDGTLLNEKPSNQATSLASALRAAAALEPSDADRHITSNAKEHLMNGVKADSADHKTVDEAVNLACDNLSKASESILNYVSGLGGGKNKAICNGKSRKKMYTKENPSKPNNWVDSFFDGLTQIQNAESPAAANGLTNGLKNCVKSETKQPKGQNEKTPPKQFIVTAFKHTFSMLISIHQKDKSLSAEDRVVLETIRQHAMHVLFRILQTGCLQSRTDYDIGLPDGDNVFMHLFKVCPSVLLQSKDFPPNTSEQQDEIRALDIIDGMVYLVKDLPERLLICMIRFLLRHVGLIDVKAYYSKKPALSQSNQSPRGLKLAKQLAQLLTGSSDEDTIAKRSRLESKLIAEAVLDFTSKIVKYSTCNLSLLTKSLRDILTAIEAETFLVTLSKLLKVGDRTMKETTKSGCGSLYTGVIDWISSVTDAHSGNIIKSSDEGLVVHRIQADVRSALTLTKTANELVVVSDRVEDAIKEQRSKAKLVKAREIPIAAYTIERLTF